MSEQDPKEVNNQPQKGTGTESACNNEEPANPATSNSEDEVSQPKTETISVITQNKMPIRIQINNEDYKEEEEDLVNDDVAETTSAADNNTTNKTFIQNSTTSSILKPSVLGTQDSSSSSSVTTTTTISTSNPFSCIRNNSDNEQPTRSSVIVAPSRLQTSGPFSSFSARQEPERKPTLLSGTNSGSNGNNNVFGSAGNNGSGANSCDESSGFKLKLRPSVLKVADADGIAVANSSDSKCDQEKLETNLFKFTPLTNVASMSSSNGDTSHETAAAAENMFQPCTSSSATPTPSTSTFAAASSRNAGTGGFVFGQNLEERVDLDTTAPVESANESAGSAQNNKNGANDSNIKSHTSARSDSSPGEKRKYEAITGEEDESNVMQIYSKLYSWDSVSSTWKEKGKGHLRLNDKMKDGKICSRLIMRTSGSLKVILNCLIVNGMKFEINNECLRFSNVDGIYIVKGKPNDIEQLYQAVEYRLLERKPKKAKTEDNNDDDKNDAANDSASKSFEIHEDINS